MAASQSTTTSDLPFVNEVRLRLPQWLLVLGVVLLVVTVTPPVWKKLERLETGADYRIPYALSKDYWLYKECLQQLAPSDILMLGDSVVWGEYVLADGTWAHFLNLESGATNRFVNGGVNGLFPLAMEGLLRGYGQSLRHRKIILHCNLLWMTSPKADLSTAKEESFNHAALVPQFFPRIPCYRADASERLNAVVERNISFLAWVTHLQIAYFGQQSIPKWTLAEGEGDPPSYPNALRNPLSQITLSVPSEPAQDPQRGPFSPRHRPWSTNSIGTTRFEWVTPDQSLQWHAFQQTLQTLREQGNDVLVVVGPFNEHLMAAENRPEYQKFHATVVAWLVRNKVPHWLPEPLSSGLYADASHPLTDGYQMLAKRLFADKVFQNWLNQK